MEAVVESKHEQDCLFADPTVIMTHRHQSKMCRCMDSHHPSKQLPSLTTPPGFTSGDD